jgi:hypothetical protein
MIEKTKKALPILFLAAALLAPGAALAHCDTLDGPVVVAARDALDTGRLEPVLAWVQPGDEREIRDAFAQARAVRKGTKEARELADRWFFETLVRVHRAGEGAPYTGLKAAGAPAPIVAAADAVAAGGDPAKLEKQLVEAVRHGLHVHHARLAAEKAPGQDVAAGRRWVAAYVPFVHWAEGVHAAASGAAGHGEAHGAGHAAHGAAPAEPRHAEAQGEAHAGHAKHAEPPAPAHHH